MQGAPEHFGDNNVAVSIDAIIIIVLVTLSHLCFPRALVPISAACTALGLLPILAVLGGGAANGDLTDGIARGGTIGGRRTDVGLLLSWMLWVNQGYFSIGLLIAEVPPGFRPRAVALVLLTVAPIVLALTILPLGVAWGSNQTPTSFVPGQFQRVAEAVVADWARIPFLVGAVMTEVVLFSSASTAAHRVLHFVAQSQLPHRFGPNAAVRAGAGLTRWVWFDTRRGTPPGFVLIVNLVLLPVMVWLPYRTLVQLAMLLAAPANVAACAAFWASCRGPNPKDGPGWVVAGPLVVVAGMLYFVLSDNQEVLGIPYFKLAVGGALYAATAIFARCSRGEPEQSEQMGETVRLVRDIPTVPAYEVAA